MNKLFYLIILLLAFRICDAQNLVPNGNFEQHSSCPNAQNQLNKALFWINPTGWTPDYFHDCGGGYAGIPINAGGFQIPLSDSAYAGIFLYSAAPNLREFIETPLTAPLIAGNCYYFEMYLNLLDNSMYSARNIGVHFSDTLVNYAPSLLIIPLTPQIVNTNSAFPDTVNWYQVSGTYVANGGESFLIIGNFDNDINTPIVVNNPGGIDYAVVYIDDVSLVQVSPCNTGIDKYNADYFVNLFPNPITDKLNITINNKELSEIIIYDITSRQLLQQKFTNSISLNTEQLARGLYIYEVRNKNGVIRKGKVVKQ